MRHQYGFWYLEGGTDSLRLAQARSGCQGSSAPGLTATTCAILPLETMRRSKLIGYWGVPPRHVIGHYRRKFPFDEFVDLDLDIGSPPTGIVPDAYCQIVTNILDNAARLQGELRMILAAVGEDKCDGGRFAALILQDLGFTVVETRNTENEPRRISICTCAMRLAEKINRVMDTVIVPNRKHYRWVEPTHGFWGVPPHDFRLLEQFPETTHVYGWTRCVEAGVPSNLNLEMAVDPSVPTVFYCQSFCAKNSLARYLADKHHGLYIDCDGPVTSSVLAKIAAFVRLR